MADWGLHSCCCLNLEEPPHFVVVVQKFHSNRLLERDTCSLKHDQHDVSSPPPLDSSFASGFSREMMHTGGRSCCKKANRLISCLVVFLEGALFFYVNANYAKKALFTYRSSSFIAGSTKSRRRRRKVQ